MVKLCNTIPQIRKSAMTALILALLFLSVSEKKTFAHGGEDHGDQKPAIAAGEKGITRTARLGAYEVTFKQPNFEPDTVSSAKLFVTKFQTNKPLENAAAMVEIESVSNGSVSEAVIEKTDTAGSYSVKIPALPQGVYTIRAKLTYNGETDTATFSGVEVAPAPVGLTENGMSLARTVLISFIFALVIALFGVLIYYVWRFADGSEAVIENETVVVRI